MSLQHIILGLLKLGGAQSGYDLKQAIDVSTAHFWYCDLSQIYRALDVIEKAAWVTSTLDAENSRNRKIYTLTPAGEAALNAWLAEDYEIEKERHSDLARLFFGRFAPRTVVQQQIEQQRQFFIQTQAKYKEVEQLLAQYTEANPIDVQFWLLTLEQGKMCAQTLIDWCDYALQKLSQIEKENT